MIFNKKITLTFAVALMSLTSCDTLWSIINNRDSSSQVSYEYISQNSGAGDNLKVIDNNNFVMPEADNTKLNNYYKVATNPYKNDDLQRTWKVAPLSSVGNQKILVIPVSFTDFNLTDKTNIVSDIDKAFFGDSDDTPWESVRSFYQKSSYNKLNLTGEVLSPITLPYTRSELLNKKIDNNYWDQTHYVLETLYYNASISNETLRNYDTDNDGFVDSIFIVYLAPKNTNTALYWAYQYYWNRGPNVVKPVFSSYAWASYDFMYEDSSYDVGSPAAHTYIHETGHLFGLNDYYDYNGGSSPLGGIDMMDHNIIDHNMYSKYVNNWALPYVVYGNADITLSPAESSGDFIIINNKWNGHAFDEYVLIEFYTPTGLNEKDSTNSGYGGSKGFSQPGIRIYHVDSRLVMTDNDKNSVWTDQILESYDGLFADFGASNTPSDNLVSSTYKQMHLLDKEKRANGWFSRNTMADNNALFQSGDKIEASDWGSYFINRTNFNDGTSVGYSIEVVSMSSNSASLKIRVA